ncbi:MAG: hypothetical protein KAI40_11160 [Desulfobacterales bacterium]|nr:hypothetical protein [Desulfobacterales bacterium]
MFYTKHKSYNFGAKLNLDQTTLDNFISLFNSKSHEKPATILTGRDSVTKININGLGSVIIKHYTRGGLISFFNKNRYLVSKKSRSELEFNFLIKAMRAGANVPQPIAFAKKGTLFYKAWLITKEIENSKNFVEIAQNEKNKAISFLPAICENINKLIVSSIHHTDLHPGNIIINKSNKPFILDFDKACYFSGNKKKLAEKYNQRWQRAIRKYKLPDELSYLELK